MKSFKIYPENLYDLYIIQNLSFEDISKILGCSRATVQRVTKRFNICKPKNQITENRLKKTKETSIKRYGCSHPFQSRTVKDKIKKTLFDKYGVENVSQNKEIQKKKEETALKNFGVKHPSQNKEVLEKCKKTCLEKYGVDSPSKSSIVKKKYKETCLKKYGCINAFQNKEIKQKSKETLKNKYGVEHSSQLHLAKKTKEVTKNKQNFINFLESIPYEKRTTKYCSEILECSYSLIKSCIKRFHCYNLINHSRSTFEIKIREWIESNYPELKVEYNNKKLIKNPLNNNCLELDFYIPELKLAIEFNGKYWHDDEWIQKTKQMSAEKYHDIKRKACQKMGIKLIYIWEKDIFNKKYALEEKLRSIFRDIKNGKRG